MGLTIYQVDAFAERPFAGNPAAVCLLPEPQDDWWMQQIAREMNLSETAFLHLAHNGFNLRWFTPTVEVELCGHATLASAHILWEEGYLEPNRQARFHTRSGMLTADARDGWIELDFPSRPDMPAAAPPDLSEALGAQVLYFGKNGMDYLALLDSEETVRSLEPDLMRLRKLGNRGVIVTAAASTAPYDFVSRFFAPGSGIDEDPVTGSAHCCLGPFWSSRLNKTNFVAYQASARGGVVHVRLSGDRVKLRGQAVTVLRSELLAG